jgi:hypothetical protein
MEHSQVNPASHNQQDLTALAKQIRDALQASRKDRCNALHRDLDVGDALIAAEGQVAEGRWKHWLRENCFLSTRTAFLYMQLARHRDKIEAEIERVGELSLRAAVRLIAKPARERPKKPPAPPLLDAWKQALPADRTAFLDHVALPELLGAMSIPFRRMLEARLRKQTTDDYDPDYQLTITFRTAMSHLQNAEETAALNALRGLARHAASLNGDFHELSVGFQKVTKEKRRRAA